MQRSTYFTILGLATQLVCTLSAQTTVLPQSTSTVQGPAVITNYSTTGPGLPASTLFESRHAQPLGVPTNQASSFSNARSGGGYLPTDGDLGGRSLGGSPSFSSGAGPLVPIRSNAGPGGAFHPEEPSYMFPGLVARVAGAWVGSDYLYNLPPDIGVVVDVVAPDNFPIHIDRRAIRDAISEIFTSSNINPVAQAVGDMAPLPFLQLLVFVQNTEESSVAFVAGRLFEGVRLLRLDYALPGSVQAITWEMQTLLVDAPNRLDKQILATAEAIATALVGRIAYFNRLKLEQEEDLRLRCGSYASPSAKVPFNSPPRKKKPPTPAPKAPTALPPSMPIGH